MANPRNYTGKYRSKRRNVRRDEEKWGKKPSSPVARNTPRKGGRHRVRTKYNRRNKHKGNME